MQPWPALKHPTPALPSRCPWALRIMVVPGEDVELGGQWRARHRWTANDLSFATVPLAASSVGFETLYEAIRKSRIVSAFPGGSPVTAELEELARELVPSPVLGWATSQHGSGRELSMTYGYITPHRYKWRGGVEHALLSHATSWARLRSRTISLDLAHLDVVHTRKGPSRQPAGDRDLG